MVLTIACSMKRRRLDFKLYMVLLCTPFGYAQTGPVRVPITPNQCALSVGQTSAPCNQIHAQFKFFRNTGNGNDITGKAHWSSSDSTVASINAATGAITALKTGTVLITLTSGPFHSTSWVVVTPAGATLSSITVAPAVAPPPSGLPKGLTVQFKATAHFTCSGTCPDQDVTDTTFWSSNNATIATIVGNGPSVGIATGKGVGTTTITGSFGGKTATASLQIGPAIVESLVVTPLAPTIPIHVSKQFAAFELFSDQTTQNVTSSVAWASSDSTVASIGITTGNSKGIKPGTTMISAAISVSGTPFNAATQLTVTPQMFDPYGGLESITCSQTTGFFHTEKIGNQWWFCTPQGNVFFMNGVYVVDTNSDLDNQGNSYATTIKAKYGSSTPSPIWANVTAARMKYWGFNTLSTYASAYIYPDAIDPSYPVDVNGLKSIPNKLPILMITRPGIYAMVNNSSTNSGTKNAYLTSETAVKNVAYALSPLAAGVSSNGLPDYFDPNMDVWLSADFAQNSDFLKLRSSPYFPYVMGFSCEDSDQTIGFGAMQAAKLGGFDTIPFGKNSVHLGWYMATLSPLQSANSIKGMLYANQQVYGKTEFMNEMMAKYGTIANLNSAWGSNYTTFGSSGVAHKNEAFATGNGSTTTFSATLKNLKPTRNSVQVFSGSVLIAGDGCGTPSSQPSPAQCATLPGTVWGPMIDSSSTINYTTGAVKLVFNTTATHRIFTIQGTNGVVTVALSSGVPHTLQVGDKIDVTGTTNYNITGATVTSVGSGQQLGYTFTYSKAGTFARELVGSYIYHAPPSGRAITISYVTNGWNQGGTGLLDEDGKHSWFGCSGTTDPNTCGQDAWYALTNITSTALKADLNNLLKSTAAHQFSQCRTPLKAYGAKGGNANILFFGPDSLESWTAPSRPEVLQAANQYIDVMITQEFADLPQSVIDFQGTYYGDKPIMAGQFRVSDADSGFSYPISSVVRASNVVTVTTTIPVDFRAGSYIDLDGVADTSFDSYSIPPPAGPEGFFITSVATDKLSFKFNQAGPNATSSGGVAAWDDTGVGGWLSQVLRGQNYLQVVGNMQNRALSSNGSQPYVGDSWWAWEDNWPERHDWGLVSSRDDGYDGVQALKAAGVDPICHAMLPTAPCQTGGEMRDYGNAMDQIIQANNMWLTTH